MNAIDSNCTGGLSRRAFLREGAALAIAATGVANLGSAFAQTVPAPPRTLTSKDERKEITGQLQATNAAASKTGATIEEKPMTQNKQTVQKYMEAFNKTHHAEILACLTDDVDGSYLVQFISKGKTRLTGRLRMTCLSAVRR